MIFYALCDVKKFKEVVHKIVMKPIMCFTLEEPQQRQKYTSKGEPGFMQTGILRGKNIANLEYRQSPVYHHIQGQVVVC